MSERRVSATRFVAAEPGEVFALLQDPAKHASFDGSGMVQASRGASQLLTLGSRFGMSMKMGPLPYRISNRVVEFEQDRLIAWAHFGKHRWRYELTPVEGGCEVTETFDWSTARSPKFIERAGYPKANLRAIEATLGRLTAMFAPSDEPGDDA
ncbi:MAG: SRPBCC family protein [Ilumatobacteraceae bacterium]